MNVVEDARIEKLMKRKFPGLSRSFYQGYEELNDEDFFEIQEIDLKRLSFIDRINSLGWFLRRFLSPMMLRISLLPVLLTLRPLKMYSLSVKILLTT